MFNLTCNIDTCSNSMYIPEDHISRLYIVNCDMYYIFIFLLLIIVHVIMGGY